MDEIIKLYKDFGYTNYIGEDITQEQHAIQAAYLAKEEGYSRDVILGALLHDIGHLFPDQELMKNLGNESIGNKDHELLGAEYLKKKGFSELTCELVKYHVYTKRYLISTNPDYYEKLSDASKKTFIHQGGLLSKKETEEFENNKHFKYHLKLREWDDLAKDPKFEYENNQFEKLLKK